MQPTGHSSPLPGNAGGGFGARFKVQESVERPPGRDRRIFLALQPRKKSSASSSPACATNTILAKQTHTSWDWLSTHRWRATRRTANPTGSLVHSFKLPVNTAQEASRSSNTVGL